MDDARAVIIGGGVAGASIAYHLTELGWDGVVMLERDELTSGSTFHSAGLVGQLRSDVNLTRMMMYSVELYRRLRVETDLDPGWHEVGSLRLAGSTARLEELRRMADWAQTVGLPLRILSTEQALELFPLFDPRGIVGAAFLPTDGYLDPTGLTMALAKGARAGGAKILTRARATGILVEDGRVRRVLVDRDGETLKIRSDVTVIAAGMYSGQAGRLAGIEVPVVPIAHRYVLTAPIPEVTAGLPTIRDPDRLVYLRPEAGGGLVLGGYERDPAPWAWLDGPPADFNNRLLPEDWERFEPLAEGGSSLVPAVRKAGVIKMINGPEAFTPDGEFILGESGVRGLFVAAGFCAHGIAGAGGVGRLMARWISGGDPEVDVWRMDIRRFGAHYRSRQYARARASQVYATYYDIHYPGEELPAGRPFRTSPTYERLTELDCEFGEKSGWERPNWYRSNESERFDDLRPGGWAGRNWSSAIAAEHVATRERAGLFDETSFAKIEVSGPDAGALLQRVCANDVDVKIGKVVYTQALNRRGGIECDFTVTRLAADRYLVVTGTAFGSHDMTWIAGQRGQGEAVEIRDVTAALACLAVWGPAAREILQPLTDTCLATRCRDEGCDGFGYMTARDVVVDDVPCLALRTTYVGELGWELYPSVEVTRRLWDTLIAAGRPLGLVPGGYRAIESMRLEKGYRAWGSDLTPEDNPFEAGLGFAVRMGKAGFTGQEALRRIAQDGPGRKLCCVLLDDPRRVAQGNEPVLAGDSPVARVTSGGPGYWIGQSIAFAYLPPELSEPGTRLSIAIFGDPVGAVVAAEPLFDPKGERIRA